MRYKVIDVYQQDKLNHYIAKSLKSRSPQFIVVQSTQTLCLHLDILDVHPQTLDTTWATGEAISLKIIQQFDCLDKLFKPNSSESSTKT